MLNLKQCPPLKRGGGFIIEHPPSYVDFLVVLGYVRTLYTFSSFRNLAFCDIPPPQAAKIGIFVMLEPPPWYLPTLQHYLYTFYLLTSIYSAILGYALHLYTFPCYQNWFFCDIPPKLAFLRNYGRYTSAVFGQVCLFYVDIVSSIWTSLQFLHFSGKDVSKVQNMSKYC